MKSVKGGLGGWCAYVEKGVNKDDQLERLKEVPDNYRNDVIRHMRTITTLAEKNKSLQT